MHPSLRAKTRLFIVAMCHYIVVRNSFGVNRRREQQYGGLFLGIPIPGLHLHPPRACARADSIIVSQIRPSHRAPLLLTAPRLQRCTASTIIHPWDSQIHRFRDAYRVFIRGGRMYEGRDRTLPKDPRRNAVIDWVHWGRLWSARKIGYIGISVYCRYIVVLCYYKYII